MFFIFLGSKVKKALSAFLVIISVLAAAFVLNINVFDLINLEYSDRTGENVYMGSRNFGNLSREEVSEIIRERLVEWQINPVDAVYNPRDNSIIPELQGYEVNVESTVEKIMNAEPGEEIEPVFEPLFPLIRMEDYPSAVITRGNPKKQKVSFMINVAWGEEYIPEMLALFSELNVKANFFVVGEWAEQNKRMLREINKNGHLIGNHGHSDKVVYTELTGEEIKEGIHEVNSTVEELTNAEVSFFTPHKGEYNDLVLEVVSRENMRTVLWSLDTVDWMEPGVEEMKSRVLDNLHNGAIILMHPTSDTVDFLKEAIPFIQGKGMEIVTLKELFNPEYYPYYPNLK